MRMRSNDANDVNQLISDLKELKRNIVNYDGCSPHDFDLIGDAIDVLKEQHEAIRRHTSFVYSNLKD